LVCGEHVKYKTMKILKYLLLVSALIGGLSVTGCKEKGPMEKAGESIDDAAKKTGDAAKEAGEKVKDAAVDAKEKAKDAVNK
jgi:hypothetical protein